MHMLPKETEAKLEGSMLVGLQFLKYHHKLQKSRRAFHPIMVQQYRKVKYSLDAAANHANINYLKVNLSQGVRC